MSYTKRRQPQYIDRSGQRRHRPDYTLVLIGVMLLVIGLIVIFSISPGLAIQKQVNSNYFVIKQLIAIAIGLVAFTIVASIPLSTWKRLQRPLIMMAGIATAVALILPTTVDYPAHRWIRFGGLSLQSVELVKFALVICLAFFLAEKVQQGIINDSHRTLKPILILLGVLGIVVAVAQKDFGSAAVLAVMIGAMSFIAGLPMKRVLQVGAVIAAAGVLLLIAGPGYRRERVLNFVHPEKDCLNSGYQACQALISVGSGGLFGKGLGHSVEAYGYLPEAANDSIFAIVAEKFGFFGVSLLLGLFTAFFIRLKSIMERAPDRASRLIVAGVLAWLSTQTIINTGAMLGLLPLKGITLPFISYGGTSIIFVLAALGLVFQISRHTTFEVNNEPEGESSESAVDWRRDRRPHYAYPSRRP